MTFSKILLCSKEHEHLLPFVHGLIADSDDYRVVGSINERRRADGYYVLELERKGNHPNMIYTYERGCLRKTLATA